MGRERKFYETSVVGRQSAHASFRKENKGTVLAVPVYSDSLEFIKSGGEDELGDKVIWKRVWGGTAAGTEDV